MRSIKLKAHEAEVPTPWAQAEINGLRGRVGHQRAPLLGRHALTAEAMEGQRIEIGRLQVRMRERAHPQVFCAGGDDFVRSCLTCRCALAATFKWLLPFAAQSLLVT